MQFTLISTSMDFDYGIHETRKKNNEKETVPEKKLSQTRLFCNGKWEKKAMKQRQNA